MFPMLAPRSLLCDKGQTSGVRNDNRSVNILAVCRLNLISVIAFSRHVPLNKLLLFTFYMLLLLKGRTELLEAKRSG